ncbi:stress protein [Crossiella cryophila]|uniref:Stress protein n=1 Tax=Crossiella cryophila TaxID=43355 RepID=A0A7W7FVK2_9PSEU|nr:stress protein [Crossiella cryophila]MBB4676944.1 hypothetical protein [Crossiella cryophila]
MGSIQRKLTAALLGAAAIGGALLPVATAQAAPAPQESAVAAAQAAGFSIDVTKSVVDITNRLYDIISNSIAHNQNRSGFVNGIMEGSFYDAGQRYNVMVTKQNHPYTANLHNIVYDAIVHSGYPDFRVIVFESGTFTNRGDGGHINWAFRGWFTRDGMTVNFRKP